MGRVRASLSLSTNDVLSSPFTLDLSSSLTADSGFVKRAKVASTLRGQMERLCIRLETRLGRLTCM